MGNRRKAHLQQQTNIITSDGNGTCGAIGDESRWRGRLRGDATCQKNLSEGGRGRMFDLSAPELASTDWGEKKQRRPYQF